MATTEDLPKAWRPPMGWNSWDSYGTTVTESEVLANARFMAEHLKDAGWDTIVVDIDWYDPTLNDSPALQTGTVSHRLPNRSTPWDSNLAYI